MPLYFAEIKSDDFCFLHFYTEFCWLIEFSLVSFTIYIITNTVPDKFKWKGDSVPDDLNLSNVWLILGFLFCAINLSRLSSRYLGSSGERSLLIMFGTFAFVGNRLKISHLAFSLLILICEKFAYFFTTDRIFHNRKDALNGF